MPQTVEIIHTNSNSLSIVGLERLLMEYNTGFQVRSASNFMELAEIDLSTFHGILIIGVDRIDDDHLFHEVESLRIQFGEIKILLIANKITNDLLRLRGLGVQGCISSSCTTGEILKAIKSLVNGGHFYCKSAIDYMSGGSEVADLLAMECEENTLSRREIEITNYIGEGLTNREIAKQLCLSIHTIHTHRKNIMRKLQVKTASELIKQAIYLEIIK